MSRLLFLIALAVASTASAVVTRHDVADAKYRVAASEFPALVDMPHEGHGVLISPVWIVTAAHAIPTPAPAEVVISGVARRVERVFVHPGFQKLPDLLVQEALKSGDASEAMKLLASSDDIALIKLASAVCDVKPAVLYRGDSELGKLVKIVGRGATGNGAEGQAGPNRTSLRRAYNTISSADERWLGYVFDKPGSAVPLEGITGGGDSGGPVLIREKGHWQLAGLANWKYVNSDARHFKPGLYGQIGYNVRISRYIGWIESVVQPATLTNGSSRRTAGCTARPQQSE